MAKSIDARLARLEVQAERSDSYTAAVQGAWEMEAARSRVTARVRLRIGEAIDAPWHPSVVLARTMLAGDTPEQHAADLEVLQRWNAAHPDAFPPDEGACDRIMAKLDEMARRREAHDELRAQNRQT
jgi:hypothetical protein